MDKINVLNTLLGKLSELKAELNKISEPLSLEEYDIIYGDIEAAQYTVFSIKLECENQSKEVRE